MKFTEFYENTLNSFKSIKWIENSIKYNELNVFIKNVITPFVTLTNNDLTSGNLTSLPLNLTTTAQQLLSFYLLFNQNITNINNLYLSVVNTFDFDTKLQDLIAFDDFLQLNLKGFKFNKSH